MLPKEETSPKRYGLATLFRNSFNAFKVSLYDTIAYQVLFAILLNIVILPFDFLFVTKGYPALVNTDIGSFLFSIRGLIAILLFALVAIAIFCIEKFGLLFITVSYQSGKRLPPFSALRQTVKKLPVELAVVAIKVPYYAAIIALFLVPGVLTCVFFSFSWFCIPVITILALLDIIFLFYRFITWTFVDYQVVIEGKKVLQAFTYKLNKKLIKQLAVTFIVWYLLIVLCLGVLIIVFGALCWLILYAVIDNSLLLAPVFSFLVALFTLLLFLFSLAINSLDSNFLTEFYYQNREREIAGLDIIVPESKEVSYRSTPEVTILLRMYNLEMLC